MSVECVILYRNMQNGGIGYVSDRDGDNLVVYNDRDAALRDVPNVPILRVSRYQIVELEDL